MSSKRRIIERLQSKDLLTNECIELCDTIYCLGDAAERLSSQVELADDVRPFVRKRQQAQSEPSKEAQLTFVFLYTPSLLVTDRQANWHFKQHTHVTTLTNIQ